MRIHRLAGHDQRLSRSRPPENTNHDPLETGAGEALDQAMNLNVVSLVTAFDRAPADRLARREKRSMFRLAEAPFRGRGTRMELAHRYGRARALRSPNVEAGGAHSLLKQAFEIRLSPVMICFAIGKSARCRRAIRHFRNQRNGHPHAMGQWLIRRDRAARIKVSGDAFADWDAQRRRRYSALPIVMLLAERFARTVCAGERGIGAGRNRRPDIFADFKRAV